MRGLNVATTRRALIAALTAPIRAYKLLLSPLMPPSCRFTPTCSTYAIQAIEVHGPLRGVWLGTKRLCRCHPWGGSGEDPVPLATPTVS